MQKEHNDAQQKTNKRQKQKKKEKTTRNTKKRQRRNKTIRQQTTITHTRHDKIHTEQDKKQKQKQPNRTRGAAKTQTPNRLKDSTGHPRASLNTRCRTLLRIFTTKYTHTKKNNKQTDNKTRTKTTQQNKTEH